MEFRRAKPGDCKGIHALNEKLGYPYDGDKVYERIISILETGSDFITVAEDESRVVGYIHGSSYETLYSGRLVNIVILVVSDDYADSEKVRQIYDVFEVRVRKNGHCGLRMTANVKGKNLFELLSQHGFKNYSDLKHYLKYFDQYQIIEGKNAYCDIAGIISFFYAEVYPDSLPSTLQIIGGCLLLVDGISKKDEFHPFSK